MKRLPQVALVLSPALLLGADEPKKPAPKPDDPRMVGTPDAAGLEMEGAQRVTGLSTGAKSAAQKPLALDDAYETPAGAPLAVELVRGPATPRRVHETMRQQARRARRERPTRRPRRDGPSSARAANRAGGGTVIDRSQFLGIRFRVHSPVTTAAVGGTLAGQGEIFGAIVALTGEEDFPDSVDLSTADVLGHALISLSRPPSALTGDLSVRLSPGWYALVFGSGRFGATGEGAASSVSGDGTFESIGAQPSMRVRGWWTCMDRNTHLFVDAAGTPPGVLANDRHRAAKELAAKLVRAPKSGKLTLNRNGTFLYMPKEGFRGVDTFIYVAEDGSQHSNAATVTILVGGRAADDAYRVDEDRSLRVSPQKGLLGNDIGEGLTASLVTGPSFGLLSLDPEGSFSSTPRANFDGKDLFLYRVHTKGGASGVARVTITIDAINDAPIANDDAYTAKGRTLHVRGGELVARRIYWTDSNAGTVSSANVDGSEAKRLRKPSGSPGAIAVDAENGVLYWFEGGPGYKVCRCGLDGSNPQVFVGLPVRDLAVDAAAGKVYWAIGSDPGRIGRANLDGSRIEDVLTGLDSPCAVQLDSSARKVYWADGSADKIQRANLDGSKVEDLRPRARLGQRPSVHFRDPAALALDLVAGKVYWMSDTVRGMRIQRANLDGSHLEDVVTKGIKGPGDLAVDPVRRKLYWTDAYLRTINRANLDGTEAEVLVTDGVSCPSGIALDQAFRPLLRRGDVLGLLANDHDPEGEALKAVLVSPPPNGRLWLSPDGGFQYAARLNFVGTDRFTYKVSDGELDSDVATVTITVPPRDDGGTVR